MYRGVSRCDCLFVLTVPVAPSPLKKNPLGLEVVVSFVMVEDFYVVG